MPVENADEGIDDARGCGGSEILEDVVQEGVESLLIKI